MATLSKKVKLMMQDVSCEYCEPDGVIGLFPFLEADGGQNYLELEAADDGLKLQVSFGTERERSMRIPYCPFCGKKYEVKDGGDE